MWNQLLKLVPNGQARETEWGVMRVEIINHNEFYYWLVEFKSGSVIEGYAKTLNAAMQDIVCECSYLKVD